MLHLQSSNYYSFFQILKILFCRILSICLLICLLTQCAHSSDARVGRKRPHIDNSMGFNRLLSDKNSLLRGVSLSWDGGDPYGSQSKYMPTQESLNELATKYGFNSLHLYLEGDSSGNTAPAGSNAADCDILVERCAKAGLYLIITIGCNGENGAIHNLKFILDFWNFYGPRYKDETHVLYEAKNEPVAHTAGHWKREDWDKQVLMYKTIRATAPDTMILLFSYMGFRNGVTHALPGTVTRRWKGLRNVSTFSRQILRIRLRCVPNSGREILSPTQILRVMNHTMLHSSHNRRDGCSFNGSREMTTNCPDWPIGLRGQVSSGHRT